MLAVCSVVSRASAGPASTRLDWLEMTQQLGAGFPERDAGHHWDPVGASSLFSP